MRTRLLLVDDHEVVRLGLRTLLEAEEDMEVVAEAGNAEEAMEKVEQYHPDVVIMDVRLPGKSGLETCRLIRQRHPTTQVVILTSYLSEEFVSHALQAGAAGYVLKEVGGSELVHAIRRAREGHVAFDPHTASQMVARLRRLEAHIEESAFKGLSRREMEVLALVSKGRSNREIARALYLSEGTVRNYVSAIMEKLGMRNRIELATYAVQHHISEWMPDIDDN